VHEVCRLNGLPAIVSDFIDGVTLRDLIESRRLAFREAAALVASVAEAPAPHHEKGLVHRDIKPANLMVELAATRRPGATRTTWACRGSSTSAWPCGTRPRSP